MKIALLSPPGLSPFSPPLSLLSLSSYLRGEGIDVLPIDTSIEALHFFLSPQNVKEKFSAAKSVLRNLENGDPLRKQFEDIEIRTPEIENIIQNIWSKDKFDVGYEDFDTNINAVNDALIFSSLNYLPTVFSLNSIMISQEAVCNTNLNPHYEYYSKILIPKLIEYQPDFIGISINYETQLVHGATLLNEINKALKVPVVVGGSFFSILCTEIYQEKLFSPDAKADQLTEITQLLQPFGIIGEGEETLLKLCRSIEKKESATDIPGVIFFDKETNVIKVIENLRIVDPKKLPILDLEGIPVAKKYLSPIPIAPILSSRGCYWNKCTFCNHATVINSTWRELSVEKIVENLKLFKDKYNVELAVFCDESMSPSMLKALSQRILEEGISINFGTMMRFEKSLLDIVEVASKAGCKYLSLGLESGCTRVVSLMKKGYTHEVAQQILDKCRKYGIAVELFTMFGFPSETNAEALETISFIEQNIDTIFCLRTSPWMLSVGSDIYNNLENYNITLDEHNFNPYNPYSYTINDGINFNKALEIIGALQKHPDIGKKVIKFGALDGFSEEYFAIKLLLPKKLFGL